MPRTPVTISDTDAQATDAISLEEEYRALTEGVGYRELHGRTVVRVTGDDRLSFVHGMCTADVKSARPSNILATLFLTEHAHIIGDFFIWMEENSLLIETETAAWPREQAHLEKLLVADDVEMETLVGVGVMHIEGPRAADALAAAGIAGAHSMKPWTYAKSIDGILARMPRYGGDAYALLGDRENLEKVADRLHKNGAMAVGESALEVVRVEHGIAKIGLDTSEKTIALEARLERSISFDKGCYLGQETVERATARGALKKKMMGLRFEKFAATGTALFLDGKEVGRVGSSVRSPRYGAIGLAILHHSAWAPGTAIIARDGGGDIHAVVSEIPLRAQS